MKRNKMENLISWNEKKDKKPLLLLGARQVGKTYLIKEFAKNNFKSFLYINFETNPKYKEIFEKSLAPNEIIMSLEILTEIEIKNETLLIFDEIQECPKAITSLKYFQEDGFTNIIAAGSFLGVSLNKNKISFPVGKVSFEYLHPFSFDEFLRGINQDKSLDLIKESFNNNEAISKAIHDHLLDLYNKYLYIGGMPEAVMNFKNNNLNITKFNRKIQTEIITSYENDMSKYTTKSETIKLKAIYQSIPTQLTGDNRKFKYSVIEKGKQAKNFTTTLEWIFSSQIVLECQTIKKCEHPLSAYIEPKTFKVYMNDIGLLNNLANIPAKALILNHKNIFKGAITENYVAQQLKTNGHHLYCWKNKTNEVDFITIINEEIIPIEVKANSNTKSKSLNKYYEEYNPSYMIRISSKNFGFENNIKSIPLYAVYLIK